MFSWNKKEEKKKPNANRRAHNLSQFGLMDIPDDFGNIGGMDENDDDDDDDLEAELRAISSGRGGAKPKRVKPQVPNVNLDAMVADSMKDVPTDEESSADENDPELLAELGELAPEEDQPPPPPSAPVAPPRTPSSTSSTGQVGLLEQRLNMYREAENNAKQAGETSRARRFNRGIKTLTDQIKQAKAGRPVPEDEIPPEVAVAVAKKPDGPSQLPTTDTPPQAPVRPMRTAPPPPTPIPPVEEPGDDDTSQLAELLRRQLKFKQAALTAKKAGDTETALKYMKVSKQFDSVIAAVKGGNPVDLSEMPDCPAEESIPIQPKSAPPPEAPHQEAETQGEADPEPVPAAPKAPSLPPELISPPPPANVAEALAQRLARYQAEEKLAKEDGNTSKSRRMGRIAKQYQDAIKMHKAGKPIPVDELPTPPGFAPIPVPGAPAPPPPIIQTEDDGEATPQPSPVPTPRVAPPPTPPKVAKTAVPPDTPPAGTGIQRTGSEVRKSPQSRQEKQSALLIARQKEFKEAALAAKRRGEIEQARELLKQAKGFDPLIQASNGGLPVDLTTLPVSPSASASLDAEGEFEYVTQDDCTPGGTGEIYERLEEDLTKQIKLCLATRDHFKATGDIAGANRFEQLAVRSKRDLNMVKACRHRAEKVPKFRYETRSFAIVQCNTDLGDNDLELSIVQGINYNVPNPKEVDTYVKFEFPFPSETPPKDKTALIKNTNNPQYNQSFPLAIARSSRACQRVFKRQAIKLEVWSKGGFLRSDTLIGTVTAKLQPLETKCDLHDSFPLMDGRKAVGGQLEVKVRVRHPLVSRQVEQRQERWLVLVEEGTA